MHFRQAQRWRWALRRRIAAHIIRHGGGSLLARITKYVGRRRLLSRLPPTVRDRCDLELLLVQGYVRAALRVDYADAATAAQRNLDTVLDTCRAAGVDAWLIRLRGSRHFRVAVRASDRPGVLRALRRCAVDRPLYVRTYRRSGIPNLAALNSDIPDERLNRSCMIDVSEVLVVGASRLRLGFTYGCQIEFWDDDGGLLTGTFANRVSTFGDPTQLARTQVAGRDVACFAPFGAPQFEDVLFDVDAVYTWVDGSDPVWSRRKRAALGESGVLHQGDHAARFRNREELRYSLRSLTTCAPWIRHVYLVTDGQRPCWLGDDPRITVVDHRELFPAEVLPLYNSHAIETRLHHIPGLSEHFLYFNDDVLLGRPVGPDRFFMSNGMSRFFLSRSTVPASSVGDDALLAARQRTQATLHRLTGRSANQLLKHTPHALRRDVLLDLERFAGNEMTETMQHKLRSPDDLAVIWLAHYYGYFTHRSIASHLAYDYFDLNRSADRRRMRALVRRRTLDTFCVNDIPADADALDVTEFLARCLGRIFPLPGPFERPETAALSPERALAS